jgi:glycosyltransferase involved in cell wall biosynthesis
LRFVTVFDHLSSVHRKNPFAVIDAFRLAVPYMGRNNCRLLIKCHASAPIELVAHLRRHAADLPINLISSTFDSSAMEDLWTRCDCYVSLHRSEGFGLPVAECLARGIPVITTHQGGVLDFTDESTVFYVAASPYRPPEEDRLYTEYSGWMEPDVADAARQMTTVAGDYSAALAKAALGSAAIRSYCNAEKVRHNITQVLPAPFDFFQRRVE